MGPYNNESREYVDFPELANGQWFESPEGYLYIVPVPGAIMEIEGPDNEVLDELSRVCRDGDGTIPDDEAARLGLVEIPFVLRRFDAANGYYHA